MHPTTCRLLLRGVLDFQYQMHDDVLYMREAFRPQYLSLRLSRYNAHSDIYVQSLSSNAFEVPVFSRSIYKRGCKVDRDS